MKYLRHYFYLSIGIFTLLHSTVQGGALIRRKVKDIEGKGRIIPTIHPPEGMILVPAGSFFFGGGVIEDIVGRLIMPIKNKTMSAFYMDAAQVTNDKYHAFLELVRDDFEIREMLLKNHFDLIKLLLKNDFTMVERLQNDPKDEEGIKAIGQALAPDMSVWKKDFGNDSMEDYFEDPRFGNYPVVGVRWVAVKIYTVVRTIFVNKERKKRGEMELPPFRLPTAAQYEYAAKGGRAMARYPWKGPYVRNSKGKLFANFKPNKGDYVSEGFAYTNPVDDPIFPPNAYGLYGLAGNVAEWCEDTYDLYNPVSSFLKTSGIDPILYAKDNDYNITFKIVKGGSYKDVAYYLQTGAFDFEDQDEARSYIGFRCVVPWNQ